MKPSKIVVSLVLAAAVALPALAADDVLFKKSRLVITKDDGDSDEEKAHVSFTDDARLRVTDKKGKKVWADIPYADIHELTYERSTHPRAKTAIFISPFALFSKGKKHWLTVSYAKGEDKDFLLLRLDKKEYQRLLATAEARTGVDVERVVEEE